MGKSPSCEAEGAAMKRVYLPLRAGALRTLCFSRTAALPAHAALPDGGVQSLQVEVQTRLSGLLGPSAAPLRIASPSYAGDYELTKLLQASVDGPAAMRIALLHNPSCKWRWAEGGDITDMQSTGFPPRLRSRDEATRLALRAYKAWVNAVAAERSAQLLREAKTTAETADELTRRMVRAGR